MGFVLYGGTAIALRLGHRTSVDFDFFTNLPLDHRKLRAGMGFIERSLTLQESIDTLTIMTAAPVGQTAGVKISFFGTIAFGRSGTPDTTDDGVIQVASIDDLMATKLKVILQRVEAKDYLDIAAMLDAGMGLPQGLATAKTLFGSAFQPSECLKALTWFEGGDLDTLSSVTKAALIDAASKVRDLPNVRLAATQLAG